MAYEVKSKSYWGLNIIIVLLAAVLIAVLLIPEKIWNEEEHYRNLARTHMENLWKVENTFYTLTGKYTENGSNAITVVNAVYDSLKNEAEFYDEQTLTLPADTVYLNVQPQEITYLIDSTLNDTTWDAYRGKILTMYNQMAQDSTNSGQFAHNVLLMVYDSVKADTNWTGTKKIVYPYQYELNVSQGYVQTYDTTFVQKDRVQKTIKDTSYQVVTKTVTEDSITTLETTTTAKNQLPDLKYRYPELQVIDSTVNVRNRWVTHIKTDRPKQSWLTDPLTGLPYIFKVSANGLHLRIKSPITGEYKEKRYVVFTFSDTSHGYIQDGEPSWEGSGNGE